MSKLKSLGEWLNEDSKIATALIITFFLILPTSLFWLKDLNEPVGCLNTIDGLNNEGNQTEIPSCKLGWDDHELELGRPKYLIAISSLILEIFFMFFVMAISKKKETSWRNFVVFYKLLSLIYTGFVITSISTLLYIASLFTKEILHGIINFVFWIVVAFLIILIYYGLNVGIARALNNPEKGGKKE